MHQLDFNAITARGDYRRRALLNFDRLEQEQYRPDNVFKGDAGGGWPGDFEGRTILALTLQAQATHREPKYLREIIDRLPGHLNERGYLGRVLPESQFDEQQLSGHSWLLRGLCEYYLWTHDERALGMARVVVENLFLPARDAYGAYPVSPEQRGSGGGAAGELTGELHGGWHCSTDIGCAFIPLDGVTQFYEITREGRVGELAEAMIAKFLELDFVGITLQTHATLTAVRGILRFYECVGDTSLLDSAVRIYDLYKSEAMTENYENYNWFAHPEWTEPCAVVDSFIVAVGLWKHTGERGYLDDAHAVLFNGMGYELRPSGGFGTNSCSGSKDEFLRVDCYEAWWCCVMRGGEGLSRAIQYLCFTSDDRVLLPFYEESTLHVEAGGGKIVLEQFTTYPTGGSVAIEVSSSSSVRPVSLCLYVPAWADNEGARCTINGAEIKTHTDGGLVTLQLKPEAGDRIELRFDIGPRSEATINRHSIPGHRTLRHGPLILGARHADGPIPMPDLDSLEHLGNGEYRIAGTDVLLTPLRSLVDLSDEAAKQDRVQILFADGDRALSTGLKRSSRTRTSTARTSRRPSSSVARSRTAASSERF